MQSYKVVLKNLWDQNKGVVALCGLPPIVFNNDLWLNLKFLNMLSWFLFFVSFLVDDHIELVTFSS